MVVVSTTAVLTNHRSRQESDRVFRVIAVREERLDDVVGECQSHDGIGRRPAECKQIVLRPRQRWPGEKALTTQTGL